MAFCSRPEGACDAISGRFVGPRVLDKRVKYYDPRLNCSRDIPPEAVGGGIFDSPPCNFHPEVDDDIVSGVTVGLVGMDAPIKLGGSRSNGFRDIRGADFVSNERTLAKRIRVARNAHGLINNVLHYFSSETVQIWFK